MPQFDDQPKIWTGDDVFVDDIPQEDVSTDLTVVDETPQLPTVEEQITIIDKSDLNDENKSMLNALVELNKTASVLAQIQNEETVELQNKVIQAICTNFVTERMRNNSTAELVKNKILGNLVEHIDVLDLETQAKIYSDLTEVSSIDNQQAMAKMSGASGGIPGTGSGGINLTLNNITGDNAGVTQNTLSVGNNAPIANLSNISNLNRTVTDWGKVPTKADIINTTSTEK